MTFHEERQLNFMTILAWKMKFFDFMTFQVFRDLYKPCEYFSLTCISLPVLLLMIVWLTGKLHRFSHRGKPVKCFCVQVLALTFFPIKPYIM